MHANATPKRHRCATPKRHRCATLIHAGRGAGGRLDDPVGLAGLVSALAWEPQDFLRYLDSSAASAAYAAATATAIARGIFGVPGMMVGDDLRWGYDRWCMLEKYWADMAPVRLA